MRRVISTVSLLAVSLGLWIPVHSSTNIGFTDSVAPREIRWRDKTINVALSSTLHSPGSNIKIGSDVIGAVRRALSRWSSIGYLNFVVSESDEQSISPGHAGDGISLITIGDTFQNNSIFAGSSMTGKTRIFYDKETGEISEADIVINPHPVSAEGTPVQFSTDGTPGTYDLESTFTHEIGHLLGLDHSSVVSSTMHARQALNGVYSRRAFTERTLSEADRAQLRAAYGSDQSSGDLEGQIVRNAAGGSRVPASRLPVWIEETKTGRLIASTDTQADGTFRLPNLAPNSYRLFAGQVSLLGNADPFPSAEVRRVVDKQRSGRNAEVGASVQIEGNRSRSVNLVVPAQGGANRFLNPRLLGTNGELSVVPVPADAGKTMTIFLAGEGVDQVTANGLTITSQYFTVQPGTLKAETFGTSFPVISFDVAVAENTPFGDYTVRVQSNSGEVAYLPGAITVDPGVDSSFANPTDDPRFFIKYQYLDFLGREPDASGLEFWVSQLESCGTDQECQETRRLNVAASFASDAEFQRKGFFVYNLYRLGLGRRPLFSEFSSDRKQFPENMAKSEEGVLKLTTSFVQRAEFLKRYPAALNADEFVDALLADVRQQSGVNLFADRAKLLAQFDGTSNGRAAVLRTLAENSELTKAEQDKAFLLLQYFGYLLRDPDEEGYRFWLNTLAPKSERDPSRYTSIICAFQNSTEYQSRFGMVITRNPAKCR